MKNQDKLEYTTIKVHPAVLRYLKNHFALIGEAFELRNHYLYSFITAGLTRGNVQVPSHSPTSYENMKEVKILITGWDYSHYGNIISVKHQFTFSRHIYKQILNTACQEILIAHCVGHIPRDSAIKNFLYSNGYDVDELNYAALRKYYQRNWMEAERQYIEDDFWKTKRGGKAPKYSTKKNVRNVPNQKK